MRKLNLFGALVVTVNLVILAGSSVTVWASADAPALAEPQVRAATRAKVRVILPSLYELPSLADARPTDAPVQQAADLGARSFPVAQKTDLFSAAKPSLTTTVRSVPTQEVATTVLTREERTQVVSR